MSRTNRLYAACVAGAVVTAIAADSFALASERNVPSQYPTIQAAIDAAATGDVVIIAPGTYFENLSVYKSLTLRSVNPEDPAVVAATIVDGRGVDSVVTFSGPEGPETVLSGLTITNGHAPIELGAAGGGVQGNGCTATITRCTITDNVANEYGSDNGAGGGLYRCDGTISHCTIRQNVAGAGGGLYACNGDILNCQVTGNSAIDREGDGGGLWGCDGTIRGCTITGNTAAWWGGGIYSSNATLIGCLIAGNTSDGGGGGLANCSGAIRGCLIVGNRNTGFQGESGGGLFHCSGTITHCTIVGNVAEAEFVLGDAGYGGGLGKCSGSIRNCIIGLNTASLADPQLYSCSIPAYCCIESWTGGGTGNMSSNPQFVDADGPDNDPATWADNDYHLTLPSPCRNAGDPGYVPLSDETDIDGQPRLLYSRVDIGADEYLLVGDITADGYVNVGDLQALVAAWASSPGYTGLADLNRDGYVNVGDLQVLVANWGRSVF